MRRSRVRSPFAPPPSQRPYTSMHGLAFEQGDESARAGDIFRRNGEQIPVQHHKIGQLADFDGARLPVDAIGVCRVNGERREGFRQVDALAWEKWRLGL